MNVLIFTPDRVGSTLLQRPQDQGILVSGIPIKLHTLHEKAQLISNIDQCLLSYNQWAVNTGRDFAISYDAKKTDRGVSA